jgi:hypothetical protein
MERTIDRIKGSHAKLDFIIDKKECNEVSFEYFFNEHLNINSINLKSILFYNSWHFVNFLGWDDILAFYYIQKNKITSQKIFFDDNLSNKDAFCPEGTVVKIIENNILIPCDGSWGENVIAETKNSYTRLSYRFSLENFCNDMRSAIALVGKTHVKFGCDQNNYFIIELTGDKEFSL